MVGGAWLGNRAGMTGAILHIANDAVMTLCVFLAVGNVVYRTGGYAFEDLKGMFRKMPYTMTGLVAGGLSMIGVPPTCGFFSKWYLISGGVQAGQYGFVAALVFSSLINAVLFFRIIEIGYYEPFGSDHGHGPAPAPAQHGGSSSGGGSGFGGNGGLYRGYCKRDYRPHDPLRGGTLGTSGSSGPGWPPPVTKNCSHPARSGTHHHRDLTWKPSIP